MKRKQIDVYLTGKKKELKQGDELHLVKIDGKWHEMYRITKK